VGDTRDPVAWGKYCFNFGIFCAFISKVTCSKIAYNKILQLNYLQFSQKSNYYKIKLQTITRQRDKEKWVFRLTLKCFKRTVQNWYSLEKWETHGVPGRFHSTTPLVLTNQQRHQKSLEINRINRRKIYSAVYRQMSAVRVLYKYHTIIRWQADYSTRQTGCSCFYREI